MHNVFPGFLTPVLPQISFQSHQLLFSHASAEVRGENTQERNFPLNQASNSGHESDMLTTEPPRWGIKVKQAITILSVLVHS